MKRNVSMHAALALAVALALPATAFAAPQATANPAPAQPQPIATLQVNGGVIMLSKDGGPFASGASNEPLVSGERLMVSEQSSATVTYNDGCKQTYAKPGVYTIEPGCTLAEAPVAGAGGGSQGVSEGVVVGGVLAGAAVLGAIAGGGGGGGNSQPPVPPVSH